VFKVVTSAALVDAGVAPEETVCFHGGRRSVERSNLADSKRDRACESFTWALARSQNAVIAKLAVRHLDPPTLRRAADSFGFGEAPAFALRAEFGAADIPTDCREF
jgi:cell division protein FtsI/penicillin-binding protein 2